MKKLLFILCLLFSLNASSQCVLNQSSTITPAGPYSPGQVVTVRLHTRIFLSIKYKLDNCVSNKSRTRLD